MKVTIEKIEVDYSEGPVIYWVTAYAQDDIGPSYWDEFAIDGIWDLILGVGEMCQECEG